MRILAISGSLRAVSRNTALLRAVARLAQPDTQVTVYQGLGGLPLFNPDLEAATPESVAELRAQIIAADAIIIASPEYAHGITGALKNALDWMVGCEAFVHKPVALFNASTRATHAQASLRETLTVMSACIVEEACAALPLLGTNFDENGIVAHPPFAALLLSALGSLCLHVETAHENV